MDQNIGRLLDNRYELLDVIGVGGMAVVYKAYCHRLHRFVAVKILKSDLASDAEFRRRFHDEAQAVAMLSHANIVSVYDVSHSDDLDYIVMELIDGITLKQYMKSKGGPLNWREALHFITQIMRALDHAHGRGIIHRDIKPQNIMVLRDGSVKVADFGIARVMSAAQNTLTQEALGSVHYISPEQARGRRIDARADIYSAGVVLYEMLTGRLPFEGDSPVSVAIQHISSTPIAPRDLNPDIPEAMETITLKAMSANVERRYRSATEMIRDLEEFRKNPSAPLRAAAPRPAPVPNKSRPPRAPQADEPTQVVDTGSIRRKAEESGRRRAITEYDEEYSDEYRNAPRQRTSQATKKRNMVPVIVVVALFLVGVGVFLYVTFFSDLFTPHPDIDVPTLVGRTLDDVMNDKSITDAFNITTKGERIHSEHEEGYILEQDPKEGTKTRGEKPEITLVVSAGPETKTVELPEMVDKPYSEVVATLTALGLKVAEPTYEFDENIEKDNVISSNPVKGTQVELDSEVTLVVSKGKEIKPVMVPQFVDLTESRVREMIKDLKLTVGNVDKVNDDAPAGIVIWQSVKAQTEVKEGTTIDLQVSLGPKEEAPATTTKAIPIELPTDRDRVTVKVTVNGEVKYEREEDTAQGTIYPNISGVSGQEMIIYFDGESHETRTFP